MAKTIPQLDPISTLSDGDMVLVRDTSANRDKHILKEDLYEDVVDQTGVLKPSSIRASKLDNPITHLFKKNKLVDTLSGNITWIRDTGKTYVDRYGQVRYSPSPNTTNLALWSEDFSNAVWSLTDGTLTPLTYENAFRLEATSNFANISQSVTGLTGTTLTTSFWIKPVNLTGEIYLRAGDAVNIPIRVDNYSDYTRVDVTSVATTTNHSIAIVLQLAGDVVDIRQAQLEESRVANGYIKTETTSVTDTSYIGIDQSCEEVLGWLSEGESTNLLTYSEDFINASWNKISGGSGIVPAVTPDFAESPDGTLSASRVVFDQGIAGGSSSDFSLLEQTVTVADQTSSIWIKGNGSSGEITLYSSTSTGGAARLDISYTEEWTRYELNTATMDRLRIGLRGAANQTADILLWGAQVETLGFATSYIPTQASPVTRAGDMITFAARNNAPDRMGAFSLNVDVNFLGGGEFQTIVQSGLGTSDVFRVIKWDNDSLRWYFGDNTNITAVPSQSGRSQTAGTYSNLDRKVYADGVETNIGSGEGWNSDNFELFYIGSSNTGGFPMYGHINDLRIYDFELNATEVAYLAGV